METTNIENHRTILEKLQITLPLENTHQENIFFILGYLECLLELGVICNEEHDELYADYR